MKERNKNNITGVRGEKTKGRNATDRMIRARAAVRWEEREREMRNSASIMGWNHADQCGGHGNGS